MLDKNILSKVLEAREERVKERNLLIEKYTLPVITISLNIPGPEKGNEIFAPLFQIAWEEIKKKLTEQKLEIKYIRRRKTALGYEGFIVSEGDIRLLKTIAVNIEDNHLMGRLFDIDITDINGEPLSREELNYPQRTCIVCNKKPAFECITGKSHSLEETLRIVKHFFL
jgi:holo-ACP synthase